jgi:hypothetical protein
MNHHGIANIFFTAEGIVTRDWGRLHWIPSDRSEDLGLPERIFMWYLDKVLLIYFYEISGRSRFSEASNSANDE